jgi:hypothetical protein
MVQGVRDGGRRWQLGPAVHVMGVRGRASMTALLSPLTVLLGDSLFDHVEPAVRHTQLGPELADMESSNDHAALTMTDRRLRKSQTEPLVIRFTIKKIRG